MNLGTVIRAARPPFLVLAPVCVLLGIATAAADGAEIHLASLALALLGALAAQAAVNLLNEYQDFLSGLDLRTERTAFSGGSGALPENSAALGAVLRAGLTMLGVTVLTGAYFVATRGWGILPLGLAGLLLIVLYTGPVNRQPFICLIAPGLGFGLLMVVGAAFVMNGEYTLRAAVAGSAPFFLINNLLLLNQYPDMAADRAVGRRNIAIAYGVPIANLVLLANYFLAMTALTAGALFEFLPPASLVALAPMLLAFIALLGAARHGEAIGQFPIYMAVNVAAAVLTPLAMAVALWVY